MTINPKIYSEPVCITLTKDILLLAHSGSYSGNGLEQQLFSSIHEKASHLKDVLYSDLGIEVSRKPDENSKSTLYYKEVLP
ncbi:MAG: hypothetical protein ACK502_10655 [Alphaproteobacteria bacterium]|jgi:hypothetical protein